MFSCLPYHLNATALRLHRYADGDFDGVRIGAIVGTCEDMCPAPERAKRAGLNDIQVRVRVRVCVCSRVCVVHTQGVWWGALAPQGRPQSRLLLLRAQCGLMGVHSAAAAAVAAAAADL